jgi:hypothetical protein
MFKNLAIVAAAVIASVGVASADPAPMTGMTSSMMMSTPDHGMPAGRMGGDGHIYLGAPDLQAAISLVTAGGAPGHFSITHAIASLTGKKNANPETSKLIKEYGPSKALSFIAVQNFAVNDAVKIAIADGVKFPTPDLHGATLAVRVTKLGLINGTYYEGTMLDHLVSHKIHAQVMNDIDAKYGVKADANYHRIADQAHYDLAQALGATTVQLAAYH